METYCLRVGKDVAGKKFPFDRIYLVHYDDRQIIGDPQNGPFRFALVLPVEQNLRTMLEAVQPETYSNRTFDRNDAEQVPAKISQSDWTALCQDGEWLMVVPILPKWMKKNMPRYLTAERWYQEKIVRVKGQGRKKEVRSSPFTSRSYLQTPEKKIRPICVVCPRMILHQNGECQIGDKVCYESLPMGLVNHFEETEALPDATPNAKELEEYHLLHGEEIVPESQIKPQSSAKDLLRIIHE